MTDYEKGWNDCREAAAKVVREHVSTDRHAARIAAAIRALTPAATTGERPMVVFEVIHGSVAGQRPPAERPHPSSIEGALARARPPAVLVECRDCDTCGEHRECREDEGGITWTCDECRPSAEQSGPGVHLRPDGKRCSYLASIVCNKCGAAGLPVYPAEPSPAKKVPHALNCSTRYRRTAECDCGVVTPSPARPSEAVCATCREVGGNGRVPNPNFAMGGPVSLPCPDCGRAGAR